MKKILLLLLLFSWVATTVEAKIRRVGFIATINPVFGLDYINFQAAHDASAHGDTIQLYPNASGGATYSGTISKQLVIMGPGYFTNSYYLGTGEFANTGLQVMAGSISSVTFNIDLGSAGTVISGLNGVNIATVDRVDALNNITVTRCKNVSISFTNSGSCDNWRISKCYGVTFVQSGPGSSFTGDRTIDNLVVENSVIFQQLSLSTSPAGSYSGNKIYNCNFLTGASLTLNNAIFTVQNCIFQVQSFSGIANTSFIKNLTTLSATGNTMTNTGNSSGNVYGVNLTNVFDAYPTNTLNKSPDARFTLKTGTNPAINGGFLPGTTTATNCGIFGGTATDAYILSGISAMPVYYQVTAPSAVTVGNNYTITFSIRSNN